MDVLAKEYVTLEVEEQIIYPSVPPLVEREQPVITSPTYNYTPEVTPGVCISSWVRVQTKQYYIPSMTWKQYETENNQVEIVETMHTDAHIMFFRKLIK